ncbi:MAG TPA: hypothetical protein VKA86_06155 [Candidatus Krumholzibacteria bacterium]|nr:hypothetical protein [Candidatus Krumholzibacteria bacterium]
MPLSSILSRGLLALVLLLFTPAAADEFGGVEFPDGGRSFADVVVDFSPTVSNGDPGEPYLDAGNALEIPDYDGVNTCDLDGCTFVSLGDGGSLTLRFADNVLTGDGSTDLDLWIFEVGPDVEDTFVEVSADGSTWFDVGKVFGSTSGIDLDTYGFGPEDVFTFVRLTDDPDDGGSSGRTVGADIDAVGAIASSAGCDLLSVDPAQPWGAGDVIEINGVGFIDGSVPTIDGVVAEPYTIVSSELIEATVPAIGDGTFTLRVELPNGQSCELVDGVVSTETASWGTVKQRFE